MKTILALLLCCSCLTTFAQQQQDNSAYQKKWFIKGADTLPYRILYPLDYNPKKKYPLVLFLHGAGERGNNNEAQLIHGAKLFADSAMRRRYPAIVVFPQCPYTDFWARIKLVRPAKDSIPHQIEYLTDEPGIAMTMVNLLLDSIAAEKTVDNKRIYVGGLSMGGMGTFEILWRRPGFFAAAFPICGGGNADKASTYANKFPAWVFHGEKDPVVDVNDSRKMVAALKAAGATVKYTEYPNVKHDSWTNAFAEPELLPWLFGQKKQ